MDKVDELDLKIIRELQKDARKSYRDIASKVKVAEGTVYNRVSKLREIGAITGFILNIDYSKLGYDLTALIGLVVEGGHLPEIEEAIAREPNVSAVYDVTGEYDAIIVAKFKNRSDLNDFIKNLLAMDNVRRTYTMIVLNILKEEHGVII
ncbi:MAG: Lrp/AsnC family transcriptional regulator [Methanosarcinales archaeon Met12]|nr:MAG: Lrp/AsnC family transcriptional regulator [Methanosarcinales archaeon Met12]